MVCTHARRSYYCTCLGSTRQRQQKASNTQRAAPAPKAACPNVLRTLSLSVNTIATRVGRNQGDCVRPNANHRYASPRPPSTHGSVSMATVGEPAAVTHETAGVRAHVSYKWGICYHTPRRYCLPAHTSLTTDCFTPAIHPQTVHLSDGHACIYPANRAVQPLDVSSCDGG